MDVAAFLLALVPIIWLVVMLLCFKWPAWKAAIGSFVLSCVLAYAWWHLPAAQIASLARGLFDGAVAHRVGDYRRRLYV